MINRERVVARHSKISYSTLSGLLFFSEKTYTVIESLVCYQECKEIFFLYIISLPPMAVDGRDLSRSLDP